MPYYPYYEIRRRRLQMTLSERIICINQRDNSKGKYYFEIAVELELSCTFNI
jgi:hypothetical protein